jgi:hypothetical protein
MNAGRLRQVATALKNSALGTGTRAHRMRAGVCQNTSDTGTVSSSRSSMSCSTNGSDISSAASLADVMMASSSSGSGPSHCASISTSRVAAT